MATSQGGGPGPTPGSPTVRRRALASALKRLRVASGLHLENSAAALEVSVATVSRYETGSRLPRARDVRELCRLYGADEAETARLVAHVSGAKETGWWERYTEVEDPSQVDYFGLEAGAVMLRQYSSTTVPGLLQTPAYAEAIFKGSVSTARPSPLTDYDIAKLVEVRIKRQSRLGAGLRFTAILEENVLRRPVGGVDVMKDQVMHILSVARVPDVSIRILPLEVGAHPGMTGGFVIVSLPGDLEDAVYLESLAGANINDSEESVGSHARVYAVLSSMALTEGESVRWLDEQRARFEALAS